MLHLYSILLSTWLLVGFFSPVCTLFAADDPKNFIYFENIKIERPITEAKINDLLQKFRAEGKDFSNEQILKLSDLRRGPDKSCKMNNDLFAYKNKKLVNEQTLQVFFSGAEDDKAVFKSLIKLLSPPRSKGNLLLNNGDKVWFYSKSSRRPLRISKQQRLMGQISNGDVLSVNFRHDYQVTSMNVTKTDGVECYFLQLKANDRSVTYGAVDYWVKKDTLFPYKARFYAISGRILKTAFYKDFKIILNVMRCGKVVINDEINKNAYSEIHYKDMEFFDIPDKHFQKNYLKFIK